MADVSFQELEAQRFLEDVCGSPLLGSVALFQLKASLDETRAGRDFLAWVLRCGYATDLDSIGSAARAYPASGPGPWRGTYQLLDAATGWTSELSITQQGVFFNGVAIVGHAFGRAGDEGEPRASLRWPAAGNPCAGEFELSCVPAGTASRQDQYMGTLLSGTVLSAPDAALRRLTGKLNMWTAAAAGDGESADPPSFWAGSYSLDRPDGSVLTMQLDASGAVTVDGLRMAAARFSSNRALWRSADGNPHSGVVAFTWSPGSAEPMVIGKSWGADEDEPDAFNLQGRHAPAGGGRLAAGDKLDDWAGQYDISITNDDGSVSSGHVLVVPKSQRPTPLLSFDGAAPPPELTAGDGGWIYVAVNATLSWLRGGGVPVNAELRFSGKGDATRVSGTIWRTGDKPAFTNAFGARRKKEQGVDYGTIALNALGVVVSGVLLAGLLAGAHKLYTLWRDRGGKDSPDEQARKEQAAKTDEMIGEFARTADALSTLNSVGQQRLDLSIESLSVNLMTCELDLRDAENKATAKREEHQRAERDLELEKARKDAAAQEIRDFEALKDKVGPKAKAEIEAKIQEKQKEVAKMEAEIAQHEDAQQTRERDMHDLREEAERAKDRRNQEWRGRP